MEEGSPSASLDYAAKAAQLWAAFDDNERSGVSIGVFPFEKMTEAETTGMGSRELAVALMRVARSEPVQAKRSRRPTPERFPLGQTVATPGALEVRRGRWHVTPRFASERHHGRLGRRAARSTAGTSSRRGGTGFSSYAVGEERLGYHRGR